ncbi:MAG: class I SAM-dependent methyltransferase [Chlorobi bacterium]|nr:class I SAM-dependent methyltransferase [Chlorobiota bacterium]
METLSGHWDKIFRKTADHKLGWYENDFSQTLKFLNRIRGWKQARIFMPGAGTSGLIGELMQTNATLVLNDLSPEAIALAKKKYGGKKENLRWLCLDISEPLPEELHNTIDIWVDRAVLHFLVEDSKVEKYFKNVHTLVKPGGHVILAEFSKKGATKCAGLNVRRYNVEDLKNNMVAFELIAEEEYIYTNPGGEPRPYIYTLFQKRST